MKKALFFDIDGTIWDYNNYICDSTKEAIKKAKEKGHLTFICSGRSRGYIQNKELLSLGFDGIVSGCGTMIEYKDDVIFYYRLDNELVAKTIETVRKYNYLPILEGKEYLYFDDEDFANNPYGNKLRTELDNRLQSIKNNWGKWEVSKLSCATPPNSFEECRRELGGTFEFIIHNPSVVEMVPIGFSKGSGILKVCEEFGIDIKDTYAFGDSSNDIAMLKTAGHSIAMGNGTEDVKVISDYVTTGVTDDGIWNACKYFGLI